MIWPPESVSFAMPPRSFASRPVGIRIQTPAGDQGRKGVFLHFRPFGAGGHCWSLLVTASCPVRLCPLLHVSDWIKFHEQKKFSRPIECVRIRESIGLDALPCYAAIVVEWWQSSGELRGVSCGLRMVDAQLAVEKARPNCCPTNSFLRSPGSTE